ncbi:hypothetical protein FB567DRAFT_593335 [Paraphoma chrysanthemicola]|uniref:BTB domain-containing protein n=1 Tax=Paraphoma chrysanthemicola TaxID=798071 RepID=A0A8K0R4Y5_9PLEO|nr:hypothetical protein FB567DRAFT_593335 [Paraphoma chrysanthemicola]
MGGEEDPADALARLSLAESIPCSKPAAKPPPNAYDHMMTIVVTHENGHEFQVYHGVLCFYSVYFKTLLDGPFKEGGSTRHVLRDVTYDVFHMFYSWMNTNTVMDIKDSTDAEISVEDFVRLYAFADFYMVEQLKNRTVELFFMRVLKDWSVSMYVTSLMYDKTTQTSLLRKLHVDICIETYRFENLRDEAKEWPQDFVIDLLVGSQHNNMVPGACTEFIKDGRVAWIQKMVKGFCSKYHEHGEPERRPIVDNL